jgi:DNA-binding protein YbaB
MLDNLMQNMFLNAKNQIEDEKKVLAGKFIDFESNDKKILLKVSAEGKIQDLKISPDLLKDEVEMVEDLLVVNINKALEMAQEVRIAELEKLKSGMMPDFGDILNSLGDMDLGDIDLDDIQNIK